MPHHRPESARTPAMWRFAPFAELSRDNRLIALSILLWGSGEGLWIYIQPLYIKGLGASPVQIGLVLSIAAVAMMATSIPAGFLADRYSRRKMILGGYLLGTLAIIFLASAQDWRQSILGFLLYYASAYCIPIISSYVADAGAGQDLNRVFTVVFSCYSFGLTVSPILGGWLGEGLGLRSVFWLSALFFASAICVVFFVAEQPVASRSVSLDYRGLLSNRSFLLLSFLFLLLFLVLYLGQPLAPNYLEEVLGLDLPWIGLLGSAHSLGAALLALWLGRFKGGWGLILAQGLVLLSLVLLLQAPLLPLLLVSFFLRGAFTASRSLSSALVGKVAGKGSLGLAFGILSTVSGLALVVAPYIAGRLYALRPDLPFLASIASIPAVMLLTTIVLRRSL